MATVIHYSDKNRFIAEEEAQEAGYLEYEREDNDGVFVAKHVATEEAFRGRGIAGEVTAAAFEHARRHNNKVRPVCPFVVDWAEKHPEVHDLLV